jgi:hypothetical protein
MDYASSGYGDVKIEAAARKIASRDFMRSATGNAELHCKDIMKALIQFAQRAHTQVWVCVSRSWPSQRSGLAALIEQCVRVLDNRQIRRICL